ncbi:MAG TPA: hypothetical protein DCZ23_06490 [Lachnospiraceae bacterium]|nr:hypothetical protein [Lachnospiraceae bacterium]
MEQSIIANINVLVVDDNAVNAMVLSAMIEHYGIKTDTAESGMEAIEKVCSTQYDIVLMDYIMPDMDGVQTTRQIMFVSEDKKKPKVMGVSATVDEEVTELFIKAGADCVLRKPVRTEDFEMKLKEFGFMCEDPGDSNDNGEDNINPAEFLSQVDGLNYDEGISLMAGNLESYMKILNVSIGNISENYNKLDVIRNTEHIDIMKLHFHSLKGIFLNIGAAGLAENSKKLETAAKSSDSAYIHANIDSYMESVKKINSQLQSVCEYYSEKASTKKTSAKIGESEFAQKLDKLKESIENFEYIEITELLEEMLSGSDGRYTDKLQNIDSFIQNFQYDEAMEVLETIYT